MYIERNIIMANAPEFKQKVGGITASVWSNKTAKGTFQSVSLNKSYKSGDTWETTTSLNPNDIPKAILALQKVQEYLFCKGEVVTPKTTSSNEAF